MRPPRIYYQNPNQCHYKQEYHGQYQAYCPGAYIQPLPKRIPAFQQNYRKRIAILEDLVSLNNSSIIHPGQLLAEVIPRLMSAQQAVDIWQSMRNRTDDEDEAYYFDLYYKMVLENVHRQILNLDADRVIDFENLMSVNTAAYSPAAVGSTTSQDDEVEVVSNIPIIVIQATPLPSPVTSTFSVGSSDSEDWQTYDLDNVSDTDSSDDEANSDSDSEFDYLDETRGDEWPEAWWTADW